MSVLVSVSVPPAQSKRSTARVGTFVSQYSQPCVGARKISARLKQVLAKAQINSRPTGTEPETGCETISELSLLARDERLPCQAVPKLSTRRSFAARR